jgi:hypothetical protein
MSQRKFSGYGSIYLGSRLSDQKIAEGLAALYSIDAAKILVYPDMDWHKGYLVNKCLVCVRLDNAGEFPTLIKLHILDSTLQLPSELSNIIRLCQTLKTNCLVEDTAEPYDAYRRVLVRPSGTLEHVRLNEADLDKADYAVNIAVYLD